MNSKNMCRLLRILVWAGILIRLQAADASHPRPLPVAQVKISDSFWAPKLEVYRHKTIPHSWFYLQGELRALRKAAGLPVEGELNGTWGEANLHKFLETVSYALAMERDPALERQVDAIIDLLAAAQQPDGYLHAYVSNSGKTPWDPGFLDGSHDGYVLGHMIEAAIEYQAATGKSKFLEVAIRAADQAYDHFLGPHGQAGFCGHAELEMALVELYRVTRNPKYLALSKAFVEWRGRGKVKPFGDTPRAYFQDHVPLREQRTLEGHAVRAIFFATGVADLAIESNDSDFRLAAHRFWDSTTLRRMAITGHIGPRQEHEALGEDYELPNTGYYESCAACGLTDFAHRMFLLEQRSESMDVLERVLYNAVLHGIGLCGTNSYYQNPLSDRDRPRFNSWVCCPPNLSRTLMQVGRYAFAQTDDELYVNLYVGGSAEFKRGSKTVKLNIATDYPWNGTVKIAVEPSRTTRFTLCLRHPGWCSRTRLTINGQAVTSADLSITHEAGQGQDQHARRARNSRPGGPALADIPAVSEASRQRAIPWNGYYRLDREWRSGDTIELILDMPVLPMVAHPHIKDCIGKIALQRGPIVYGFEGLDNHGSARILLTDCPDTRTAWRPELLGGVTVIEGTTADGGPFVAVPFYAMANRDKSSQEVWATQSKPQTNESWWLGQLYRPWKSPVTKP